MNKKVKVMYVDDEFINRELFEINFSGRYEVYVAENGSCGLETLEQNSDIAVVISDMKMPAMNGLEFARAAKQRFSDTKFYLLTGFGMTEEIRRAVEEGIILRCLSKPFNLADIEMSMQN